MQLNDLHTAYFIGIGGIGMSALARYFRAKGLDVHGYDKTETALTRTLAAEGMHIHYEDDPGQIPEGVDLVVYTPAIPEAHRELRDVRTRGLPVRKRAEVLGLLSLEERTIAVAGTHGKTTTSCMLSWLLVHGGLDCTAFLGGIATNFGSNYRLGASGWMVVEADEYDRSFLHLHPERAVILSMEPDHLDIYGDEDSVVDSGFRAFAGQVVPGGLLYVQQRWARLLDEAQVSRTFGLGQGDYRAEGIRVEQGCFAFDLHTPEQGRIEGFRLPLPGRHNVENATAALAVALELGLEPGRLRRGLQQFKGVKRRFELRFRRPEVVYVDDYAHHPTELQAAIRAAREFFPGKRIKGIFQPHLYSRTRDFAVGFAQALDELDEVILLDIYPAREAPIPGVSAELIRKHMKKHIGAAVPLDEALDKSKERPADVWMTLGAGNIDTLAEPICAYLAERYGPNQDRTT